MGLPEYLSPSSKNDYWVKGQPSSKNDYCLTGSKNYVNHLLYKINSVLTTPTPLFTIHILLPYILPTNLITIYLYTITPLLIYSNYTNQLIFLFHSNNLFPQLFYFPFYFYPNYFIPQLFYTPIITPTTLRVVWPLIIVAPIK